MKGMIITIFLGVILLLSSAVCASAAPHRRGAMIGTPARLLSGHEKTNFEASLRDLRYKMGANLIRWQLVEPDPRSPVVQTWDSYWPWLQSRLEALDQFLPLCQQLGLRVIIDLHTPPGGCSLESGACTQKIFLDSGMQQRFKEVWNHISRRYRNNRIVWAYDLCNEPSGTAAPGLKRWNDLASEVAAQVRRNDPIHQIIIESVGASIRTLPSLKPVGTPGVIYSVHIYPNYGLNPNSLYWDTDYLRGALQRVKDWQRRNRVQIYVGEFAGLSVADPHYHDFMNNVISLFEEYDWPWTYHAWREASVWDVERCPDLRAVPMLRRWFSRNRR